ncbi:MAG TPA: NUDIX domain-containing protein [Candidatus Dormibacteraeota bacterium]|nr:NUDIX domain-containing protein [Candidatus Dormibacteraeota bacterium]
MTLHGSEPRPHSTRSPHRFCPACGSGLVERDVEGRSLGACPHCDFIAFRDPKVVAVAALLEDHHVWLLRRGIEPRVGQWALPGGYVDYDEHPADAAARECLEEIGCDVAIERLLGVHHAAFTDGGVVIVAYLGHITRGRPRPGPEALEVMRFPLDTLPPLAFTTHQEILAALQ